MSDWEGLLQRFAEVPRENGTAALDQTATFLVDTLSRAGVDAELLAFDAHPYGLRLAGVFALAGSLLFARFMWAGHHVRALAVAVLLPALLLVELEFDVPIFGWIGAREEHHVRAAFPVEEPQQRLLLSAHYDTKTDLLDHVQRAPVDFGTLPAVAVMVLGAGLFTKLGHATPMRRRLSRGVGVFGGLYGFALFVTLSSGAFVRERSPGALDDGASCAVLARLAETLAAMPALERTHVDIVWFAAEEVGVQGSREFVAEFGPELEAPPTYVLNLEGIGASTEHAVLGGERSTLSAYEPDPRIVELLATLHRRRFGRPLIVTSFAGATDARSFLAAGIPAATMATREPGQQFTRGLHSVRDDRARLDESSLDGSLAYLVDFVKAVDAGQL